MKVLKTWYRKLVALRGADTTPRLVLERMLDKVDRVQSVCVLIEFKDGSFDIDWSKMSGKTLALMHLIIQQQAIRNCEGLEQIAKGDEV